MSNQELSLKDKKILLLYARFFGYDKIVKEKLERLGAKVDLYDARANINTVEKAIKKIYSQYYYKKQRKFNSRIQEDNQGYSYDFIFSNENIEVQTVENYRKQFRDAKLILYLDDSIANMKGVEKTFKFYDSVFTFDRRDAEKYHVIFRPLFYCDAFKEQKAKGTRIAYDVCFVGTCHSDRLTIINQVFEKHPNYRYYIYCYLQSWFMYCYYKIIDPEYRRTGMDFFKYKQMPLNAVAERMAESIAVLDIQHPKQTGLTMRTIETLGLGKKLITTNRDIEQYDFFIRQNILVIDRDNPVIPKSFINCVSVPLNDDLVAKYSLEGWIKEVFAIQPDLEKSND